MNGYQIGIKRLKVQLKKSKPIGLITNNNNTNNGNTTAAIISSNGSINQNSNLTKITTTTNNNNNNNINVVNGIAGVINNGSVGD